MIWLGYLAGALTTFSFVPQIIRVFKTRSAHDISLWFNTMLFAGILLWLAYGICSKLTPVIIWNAIAAVLTCTLLYAKIRYGRDRRT
ncbi:MAG: SemiSWEET transporter [Dehalococcoidia bacterium]